MIPAGRILTLAMSQRSLYVIFGGIAIFLFIMSLAIGRSNLPLIAAIIEASKTHPSIIGVIFSEIRLPRAILGLMAGATLGLSGAALQGLLRNPLAEPGLIGITASASLGSVLCFYFGLANVLPLAQPIGGMLGAASAVVLVYLIAWRDTSILTLILAGVAVSSFAGALTSLALNLAPNPFATMEIVYWLLGSLADRSFEHVWLAGPPMLLGWVLLMSASQPLDALSLGDNTAATLGFNLASVRIRIILGTSLSVGAAVSVMGGVGFVGLIVPHLIRPLVGHEPSRLLPLSALGGASLLMAADIIVRLLSPSGDLKLGVVTAIIGAPFFLYLVLATRRSIS